jgi:hypothetical protein
MSPREHCSWRGPTRSVQKMFPMATLSIFRFGISQDNWLFCFCFWLCSDLQENRNTDSLTSALRMITRASWPSSTSCEHYINFEVFIRKEDGLSDDHKIDTQRDIH